VHSIRLTVNGREAEVEVSTHTLLVDVLREHMALRGTHVGCDTSQCGCCTVLLNGESVRSCAVLAVQAEDAQVTTVEGLANDGTLHPIQEAFSRCHGLQCGFCTPGMIMTTACLLATNPNPGESEIIEALEGNLCRCTGYVNIVASVQEASRLLRAA